ncbi:MAG: type IV pilus twitching motility protein PilT [Ruminiclostridium sp.]
MTIDQLINFARSKNASDIHLTAGAPTSIRINGELKKFDGMDEEVVNRTILSMLSAEQEKRLGQGEDIDFSFTSSSGGRQRVNVYHQNGGRLAAAIRLLNEHIPSFKDISLPQAAIDLTKELKGLILVTGPTGSGKSTTLATMVDYINVCRPCHILTIEDPIEYIYSPKLATIHQREIGTDVPDFNYALRSGLRENPDVILVGEMRDYETIQLALTAAETGHLVLGTLHTTGAAQTVNRIIDVFPSDVQNQIRSQLSSNLRGVISQMLLPMANAERGRTAAFEILINNDACANNIRAEKTHQLESVMASNMSNGMRTMNESLKRLARDGVITKETAITYSPDKDELKKML